MCGSKVQFFDNGHTESTKEIGIIGVDHDYLCIPQVIKDGSEGYSVMLKARDAVRVEFVASTDAVINTFNWRGHLTNAGVIITEPQPEIQFDHVEWNNIILKLISLICSSHSRDPSLLLNQRGFRLS